MNGILDDCQEGLEMLDDLKKEKKNMKEMANDVAEEKTEMKGSMELTEGGKDSNGIMGLAKGMNTSDNSSESEERASDDTYSLASFFSDIQSFGSDAAEILEESKKFFTKLGAVVAIIGTCINTAGTLADAIRDEEVKTAVFTGILLIGIQIPTTLAMLFVFLKEWVKATITGFLMAKKELEEIASDLDSLVDDTESDEKAKDLTIAPSNSKDKIGTETDGLKRDLEKTKKKNSYDNVEELQKHESIGSTPVWEKKVRVKKNKLVNGLSENKHNTKDIEHRIREMEEGEKPENFQTVSQTALNDELPRTYSSNRERRIHEESPGTSSKPPRTASQILKTSSKPIKTTDAAAQKNRKNTSSKDRNRHDGSSSPAKVTHRQVSVSSRRSSVTPTKRSDSQKERRIGHSSKYNEPTKMRKSNGEKRVGPGREACGGHHSEGAISKTSVRSQCERVPKEQKKKLNQSTQTTLEDEPLESKPAFGEK